MKIEFEKHNGYVSSTILNCTVSESLVLNMAIRQFADNVTNHIEDREIARKMLEDIMPTLLSGLLTSTRQKVRNKYVK